jgi:RNA recognition motif. (a.k.a. RRM, RBD, or RNP domain)
MMRHTGTGRTGQPCDGGSSSEEDDVFSALSRKRKGSKESSSVSSLKKQGYLSGGVDRNQDEPKSKEETQPPMKLPVASTSSTKRHHGEVSDARKAKMDALLLELEAEKNRATAVPIRHHANERNQAKGSFVDPGDEHLTTNIFVGNLAPSITEEQMTDLFRQFGEHSLILFACRML